MSPRLRRKKTKPAPLLFEWNRRGRRRWSLFFFLLVALALHAFALYLFRPVARGSRSGLTTSYRVLLLDQNQTNRWLQTRLAQSKPLPPDYGSFLGGAPSESGVRFRPSFENHKPPLRNVSLSPGLPMEKLVFAPIGSAPPRIAPPTMQRREPQVSPAQARVLVAFSGSDLLDRVGPEPQTIPWTGGSVEGLDCLLGIDQTGRIVSVLPATGAKDLPADLARAFSQLRLRPSSARSGVVWGWVQLSHNPPGQ